MAQAQHRVLTRGPRFKSGRRLWDGSPDGWNTVCCDSRIAAHQRDSLRFGLSDEQAIERIALALAAKLDVGEATVGNGMRSRDRLPGGVGKAGIVTQPPQHSMSVGEQPQSTTPRPRATSSGQASKSSDIEIRPARAPGLRRAGPRSVIGMTKRSNQPDRMASCAQLSGVPAMPATFQAPSSFTIGMARTVPSTPV